MLAGSLGCCIPDAKHNPLDSHPRACSRLQSLFVTNNAAYIQSPLHDQRRQRLSCGSRSRSTVLSISTNPISASSTSHSPPGVSLSTPLLPPATSQKLTALPATRTSHYSRSQARQGKRVSTQLKGPGNLEYWLTGGRYSCRRLKGLKERIHRQTPPKGTPCGRYPRQISSKRCYYRLKLCLRKIAGLRKKHHGLLSQKINRRRPSRWSQQAIPQPLLQRSVSHAS